ncbi:MAG: aminotransferase class I/II-fold pyridoxal phosphate-dependent enzyme, partial [Chitinophagaceae bacterium]
MKVAKRLDNVGEYYFSQKLRQIDALNLAGRQVINLGVGSPDLPPHPEVVNELQQQAEPHAHHAYQAYKGTPLLRQAMAKWYKTFYHVTLNADNEILPLMGSKEGIMHICMTYLEKGDKALVPNPGYPTYSAAVQLAGAQPLFYNLRDSNNWLPDMVEVEQEDLSGVKLMFVNYPHMPTGALPTPEIFAQLVAFAIKHQILLVNDNPYSFILNERPQSLLETPGAMQVALELNSLSKSHNMAGWRVGMLLGNKQRIDEVLRFKSNMDSGMFLPLQLAAAKALELDADWHRSVNEQYQKRQALVFRLLEMLGCRFSRKQAGMFVWAAVPGQYNDAYALSDK